MKAIPWFGMLPHNILVLLAVCLDSYSQKPYMKMPLIEAAFVCLTKAYKCLISGVTLSKTDLRDKQQYIFFDVSIETIMLTFSKVLLVLEGNEMDDNWSAKVCHQIYIMEQLESPLSQLKMYQKLRLTLFSALYSLRSGKGLWLRIISCTFFL